MEKKGIDNEKKNFIIRAYFERNPFILRGIQAVIDDDVLELSIYNHSYNEEFDKDFFKPQAFHDLPVTRSGGIAVIFSLSFFFIIYFLLYSEILYDYIFISYSVFLVGFLDDLRINIKPFTRLIIMIFLVFIHTYICAYLCTYSKIYKY